MIFTEKEINRLEASLKSRMSEWRYVHTLGVKKSAEYLGKLLLPELVSQLCVAALLHDVSKELSDAEQRRLIEEDSIAVTADDWKSRGVIHSFTAPSVIARDFPEFGTENILSAVGCHTLGKPDMSLFDKIIYISDYVEENRTYDLCVKVRDFLLSGFDGLSYADKLKRLDGAIVLSIDLNVERLIGEGREVNKRMLLTREAIAAKN